MDSRRVFTFLNDQLAAGQSTVLVTVVAVEGSSMRGPGTHMGVCADGSFVGSLSGGCIENAVVAEALDVLKEGAVRVVRFGSGSPYIDIQLPCGGGLDIHFLSLNDVELVGQCWNSIEARRPFSLELSLTTSEAVFVDGWRPTECNAARGAAIIGHWPEPRLLIIGHGATVSALSRLAGQMDVAVQVFTPDERLIEELTIAEVPTTRLVSPADVESIQMDQWAAATFLFHDHDWEIALIEHVLDQPHFYVGAMGGRRAHEFRTEALSAKGVTKEAIAAIHSPIGLFHSSRDPETLALSTLAQVVQAYHQYDFANG